LQRFTTLLYNTIANGDTIFSIIFRPALRALGQAGGKEGGWGEGISARLPSPRQRRNLFFGGAFVRPSAGRSISFLKLGIRIFFKKSSDFVQKAPHFKNFSF